MPVTGQQILIRVSADGVKQTKDELRGVSDESKGAHSGVSGFLSTMGGFLGANLIIHAAGTAWNVLKGQVVDSYQAGMDANIVLAQTVAGLKSTHDVSGMTAQSIGDLATHIMNLSGIDDDAVQTGENMLLTFTNVGKKVFPEATQAIADMATKMNGGAIPSGQQMQQTAILLGKALNDPTHGITALTRVGVTFDSQQKKQIATMLQHNDVAGAQGVILKEIQKEFGGAASAAGHANGGIAILNAQWNNMKEALGQQLIPIMARLLATLQPVISGLLSGLGGAINSILPLFNNLMSAFGHNTGLIVLLNNFRTLGHVTEFFGSVIRMNAQPAITQLSAFFTAHLLPAINRFVVFASSTLVPMFSQIAIFVLQNVVPALLQLGAFVTDTLLPAVMQMVAWFRQNVLPILEQVAQVIFTNVLPVLEQLAGIIITKVIPPIQRIVALILPVLIPAFQAIGWVITNVVGPVLGTLLTALGWLLGKVADVAEGIHTFVTGIGGAFSRFGTLVHNIINGIGAAFVWLYNHNTYVKRLVDFVRQQFENVKTTITNIWNGITSFIGGLAGRIGGAVTNGVITPIKNLLGGLAQQAIQWGENLIKMFTQGITNQIGAAKSAASSVISGIAKVLGFHSPTEEGPGADADTWAPNLIRMFAQGLAAGAPDLRGAAATAMAGVRGALTGVSATGAFSYAPSANAALGLGGGGAAGVGGAVSGAGGSGVTQQILFIVEGQTLAQAMVTGLPQVVRVGAGIKDW